MKKITLYCDGSSLGNPGFGGWCAILSYQNDGKDFRKIISGGVANTTNNRMELSAVVEGLKALKEPCCVEIISDSKYVCDGINLWLKNWIVKNFREVKNPDLWREYVSLSTKHIITAAWVKGHSGHAENEECDKIAKAEAEKVKKSGVKNSGNLFDLRDSRARKRQSLKTKKRESNGDLGESGADSRDFKDSADSSDSSDLANPADLATKLLNPTKLSKKIISAFELKNFNDYRALQARIDYRFNDENLLILALTHKSFDKSKNNERLEFLGDAVLDLIIGDYLFHQLYRRNEGVLTKIRAAMVNENSLANLANALDLGKYLLISKSESRNAGHKKPSILSDAFEALIGAIYIDGGLESARKLIISLLEYEYKGVELENLFVDYKTALQEITQAICGDLPEYVLVDSSGPDHNKSFTMEVLINGQKFATAKGKSKKDAEQTCAKIAYNRLKREQSAN